MSICVGIDLGTTFSAVAYVDPKTNLPQIITNREGNKLTPSVIQFIDGETVFGSEAQDAFTAGEDNCIGTFKRDMGETTPYCYIDGSPLTSEDLSAMLLKRLKEDAEAKLNDTINEAVITVPAYFLSKPREATIRAAAKAGIKVKRLIDEPNAAAMAYGLNHWRENANILVYDLGGGTFDVTLVHMGKNCVVSAIATRGNHKLGGRDWDAEIEDILISKFTEETDLDIRNNIESIAIIKGLSEGVKKQLSAPNMQSVKVSASFPEYGNSSVTVTKAEFEEKTSYLLERTGALCSAVLKEVGLSQTDISDVLLVGGSTRMPQVREYLKKMFKKEPLSHVNPDEAVALGAAIQASKENEGYSALAVQIIDGKKQTDRSHSGLSTKATVKPEKKLGALSLLTLRETTAHAMGVIAINDENRYYNEIIIPANHPRPVKAAKKFRFYTSPNTDNELAIYVLQGENENPLDNQITNKYVVTGIKHVVGGERRGTVIRIQYSYDVNGIIHIQARQDASNKDLPIRREDVPADISKFGRPVTVEDKNTGNYTGLQKGNSSSQKIAHKYVPITFSNVEWVKYDNISYHADGSVEYNEPKIHVEANEKEIRFEGYNISAMDEGVFYSIDPCDDFEIECDIDTSTIQEHPGGYLDISLGIISAHLNQNGGSLFMDSNIVASVGSKFHLRMSLTNCGTFEIEIDGNPVGKTHRDFYDLIDVRFGFVHGGHHCERRSIATVSDITMMQRSTQDEDESNETDTWDTEEEFALQKSN